MVIGGERPERFALLQAHRAAVSNQTVRRGSGRLGGPLVAAGETTCVGRSVA